MAQGARLTADAIAAAIPVTAPERLLDIGGSHGLHAAALCRRHPGLRATVLDLEAPVRIGREVIAAEGLADRVQHRAGDAFADDLGSGYDVVTAHAFLHNFAPERCVELLRRAHAALRPGGTFAAQEIERPPPGRPGSLVATLGSLVFHVWTGTRAYTAAELAGFAREAGFADVRVRRPLALPGSVILSAARASGSGP
jgi:cyclopropane fatty-acyl-phospholipid synthase-like methyltransferase